MFQGRRSEVNWEGIHDLTGNRRLVFQFFALMMPVVAWTTRITCSENSVLGAFIEDLLGLMIAPFACAAVMLLGILLFCTGLKAFAPALCCAVAAVVLVVWTKNLVLAHFGLAGMCI